MDDFFLNIFFLLVLENHSPLDFSPTHLDDPSQTSLLIFLFPDLKFIFFLERERESMSRKEGQREREREREREKLKQAPPSAQSPMWGSIPQPRDRDLS